MTPANPSLFNSLDCMLHVGACTCVLTTCVISCCQWAHVHSYSCVDSPVWSHVLSHTFLCMCSHLHVLLHRWSNIACFDSVFLRIHVLICINFTCVPRLIISMCSRTCCGGRSYTYHWEGRVALQTAEQQGARQIPGLCQPAEKACHLNIEPPCFWASCPMNSSF